MQDQSIKSRLLALGLDEPTIDKLFKVSVHKEFPEIIDLLKQFPLTKPEAESETELIEIESPMFGQLYWRPSPDADQFVKVGDIIEPGTQVGLIEAMKVFSEINYEGTTNARVESIASSGLKQTGDVIMTLEPIEE